MEDVKNTINVFVPKNIIKDNKLSSYAIAVYCVLQTLYTSTYITNICVTSRQIVFILTDDIECFKHKTRFIDHIRDGIEELIEDGVIKKIDKCQNYYILDCSSLWVDTKNNYFSCIRFDEIKKIFKTDKVNSFALLVFYINIIGSVNNSIEVKPCNAINKSGVICDVTLDYLSNLNRMSVNSVIEYIKILEEIELLYVYRSEMFIFNEKNEIKSINNIYGRFEDKEYVDAYAMKRESKFKSYNHVVKNVNDANNKRRLTQKYNQLLKGSGNQYTREEIYEIYKYIVSNNDKYYELYDKTGNEDYLNNIRDTDIFDQFNFPEEEQ